MNKIEILCDSYQITGPRQSDGAIFIKFGTGEYQMANVGKLLTLPPQTVLKLTIEVEE